MRAWYLVRADLRHRWGSALILGVLVGLAGAVIVTGISGARRGPAAFDQFSEDNPSADVTAFPVDQTDMPALLELVAGVPGVDRAGTASFVVAGEVGPNGRTVGGFGGVLPIDAGHQLQPTRFLDGEAPTGPFELAVNEAVADRLGLAPGDHLPIAVYAAAQIDQASSGRQVEPAQGVHDFTVTGIFRLPADLRFQATGASEHDDETVLWSSALWDRYDGDLANYGAGVLAAMVPDGDPDVVVDAVGAEYGDSVFTEVQPDNADAEPIRRVIDLQSTALLVATGVLAIVALALALQALSRQLAGLDLGDPVLGALGVDRRTAGAAAGSWALVVGLVSVPVLVAGSLVGSLLMPIGVATRADFTDGPTLDLGIVAVTVVVIVGGLLLWGIVRGRASLRPRPPRRAASSPIVQLLSRANGGPVPRVGAALGAGTSREISRVPNRTAIVGLAVGVAGIVAALVFGASLDRLTTDPDAFGWSWDVTVANCSTLACTDEAAALLRDNPDVEAYTGLNEGGATIAGEPVTGGQYRLGRGWAGGKILDGRPPAGPEDLVLGRGTAEDLDAEIGDQLDVQFEGGEAVPFRVVGIFVPPAVLSDGMTLSRGAGITSRGLRRAAPQVAADLAGRSQAFLVRFDPDVDRAAAMAQLREDFPTTVQEAVRTPDVEGVFRLRQLPQLLAAFVAVLALLTLIHFVVATARRRRTALATLQALGGRRALGRGALAWHATLVVFAGLAVGVPIGIAIGRVGWGVAADALEVPVEPLTPVLALVAIVIGVAFIAAALGGASYRLRARSPALALRGD